MTKTNEPSFPEAAERWARRRKSERTRAAYARDLVLWFSYCKKAGIDPGAPPKDIAFDFRKDLEEKGDKEKPYKPLSIRRVFATLSAAFVAIQPGTFNPFSQKNAEWPSVSNYARTRAISDEDARKVIEAAGRRGREPLRDRALLWVLWSTGMRRISAVSIRRDGVFRRDGVMIVRHVIKGGPEEESELSEEAAQAVEAWIGIAPSDAEMLFCQHFKKNGRGLSAQAVTGIVMAAAKVAEVRAHPHQFRSAFITRGLDAGIHIERVRAAVHHKDIRSTLRYDRGQRGAGVAAEVAAFRAKKE